MRGSRKQKYSAIKSYLPTGDPQTTPLKKNLITRNKVKSGDAGGQIFHGRVSDPLSLLDKLAAKVKRLGNEKKIH